MSKKLDLKKKLQLPSLRTSKAEKVIAIHKDELYLQNPENGKK